MRVGVFSAKRYDRDSLLEANARSPIAHELVFLEARLSPQTASIGATYPAVCAFVNDRVDASVLATLAAGRTRLVSHDRSAQAGTPPRAGDRRLRGRGTALLRGSLGGDRPGRRLRAPPHPAQRHRH